MTRKDYIRIASIIKEGTIQLYDVNNDTKDTLDIRYMLVELCIMFKQDNKTVPKK